MRVEWTDEALDRLADIHVRLTLDDQDALERAVLHINSRLAADPWFLGEERDDDRRIWFHAPLVVIYRLETGGVVVSHVDRFPRPRGV